MAQETKHTAGPWHVEGMYVFPLGYQSNPVCGVSRCLGQPDGQISANARLIAAAPEMLELLKGLHRELVRQGINFGPYIADAEALIAKAEGAA